MTETITLRGYAVPFAQTAHVGGGALEQFAPGAFAKMLESRNTIGLLWEHHEDWAPRIASTARGTLSFFEDQYGLGFSATIGGLSQNWSRLRAMTQKANPLSFCSVGGLAIKASRREQLELGATTIVEAATIDHVTICNSAACYRNSAVWPAHLPLDLVPLRIQELADTWTRGHAEWKQRQAAEARAVAQSRVIGRTVGGHFVMCAPNGQLWSKHGVTGRKIF